MPFYVFPQGTAPNHPEVAPHAVSLVASSIGGSSAPRLSSPHADVHLAYNLDLTSSFALGPPVPAAPAFSPGHPPIPCWSPPQAHIPQAAQVFPAAPVPLVVPTAPTPVVSPAAQAPVLAPPKPVAPPPTLAVSSLTPARVELLKLDPMKDAKEFLDLFKTIQYYLRMPEFSTGHANGSLTRDLANLEASWAWEGQLCLAMKDGSLCFLFVNKGTQYHGQGFEMRAALTQNCFPGTVSNAFASLLSLFNDVQGELESILEYRSRFNGLTLELLQCKVAIPPLLLVVLFLWAIHSCYADIIEQFCS